jgi:hypothetical protein
MKTKHGKGNFGDNDIQRMEFTDDTDKDIREF